MALCELALLLMPYTVVLKLYRQTERTIKNAIRFMIHINPTCFSPKMIVRGKGKGKNGNLPVN
jgi:hypothetical protein